MKKLNRLTLIKIHLLLAALSLATVLMFFITGILYTIDYEAENESFEHRVTEKQALKKDLDLLTGIVKRELAKLDIDVPMGEPEIERDKKRRSFKLYWSDRNMKVTLRPSTVNPAVAVIKIKQYSWYYRLMRLHKGSGGNIFILFTLISTIFVILVLISGVIIGLTSPALRRLTGISLALGLSFFIGIVGYVQYFTT